MIAAATLRRLVEGLGTGARVDEKDIGGVDERDKDGMKGVRCCSAHSNSRYHRWVLIFKIL